MIENLLPLAGTVAFGPIGGAIGTAAAGAIGMGRAKGFEDKYNKADRQVNPVDPLQLAYMNDLKRQEQAYRAGTDPASGFAMSGVRDQGATASANILRAGGRPGDLLRSQRISDRGYADIAARSSGIANQLLGMRGGVVNDISDRVFGEQKYHRGLAYGRWQNERQDANNNLMAATGMLAQAVPEQGLFGEINFPRRSPSDMQTAAATAPTSMPANQTALDRSIPSPMRRGPAGAPPTPTYAQPNPAQQLPYTPPGMGSPVRVPWGPPVADPRSQYAPWTNY